MSLAMFKLSQILKLEYGKGLPDSDRDFDGIYAAYGANGIKSRTNKFLYDKPSIIVGRKGSAGELTLVTDKFWALDVTYYVTHDDSKTDLMYLYYALQTKNLTSYARGVKPGINRNDVYELEIPLPSLPTQKKIVAKLDAIFAEIDKATAAAEANAKNAEALFQSYLTKVFEEIKMTWDEKILSEVCDVRDGTHDSPKYVEHGIPFVTQKNIRKDGLNLNDVKFISDDDHNKFYKRSNVAYGDILISMIGANRGMSAIVDDARLFSIKNVCLVKQGNKADQNYLLYFFRSVQAQNYIQLFSNGGAQEFIGLTALRKLPIPMPSKEVQEKVVDNLSAIFSLSKVAENNAVQKLNSLVKLKQAILKQAFNGELVKD